MHPWEGRAWLAPTYLRLNDALFAVGGFDGKAALSATEVLDLGTLDWEVGPSLRAPRRGFGIGAHGEYIFVVGGVNDGCLGTLEVFSVSTCKWQEGPPMATPRRDLGVAVSGGRIFAVGGHGGGKCHDCMEVFDTATWRWRAGPPMPAARCSLAAAASTRHIFAVGGSVSSDRVEPVSLVSVLDVEAWTWDEGPPLGTRRCELGAAAHGDRIFAIGGNGTAYGGSSVYLDTMEVFDPSSWLWEKGPPMSLARSGLGVAVSGGRIFVMGGPFAGVGSTTTEVFDVAAWRWETGPTMPTKRWGLGLAVHDGAAAREKRTDRCTAARCELMKAIGANDPARLAAALQEGELAGLDAQELGFARAAAAEVAASVGASEQKPVSAAEWESRRNVQRSAADVPTAAGFLPRHAGLGDPRPNAVMFEDPRDPPRQVGVIGFSFCEPAEDCDGLCGCPFLGNFWELGMDGLQLEAKCPFKKAGEEKCFMTAEAAFQALKFWYKADEFRYLTGTQVLQLVWQLKGREDYMYGGYGTDWLAMLAVLRAKFSQNRPCADGLLRTGDAFLLHHSGGVDRDKVWSDNHVGDGTNWLGTQLMLIRDEMRRRSCDDSSWTRYIQTSCGLDPRTGQSRVNGAAWQNIVWNATQALAQRLGERASLLAES